MRVKAVQARIERFMHCRKITEFSTELPLQRHLMADQGYDGRSPCMCTFRPAQARIEQRNGLHELNIPHQIIRQRLHKPQAQSPGEQAASRTTHCASLNGHKISKLPGIKDSARTLDRAIRLRMAVLRVQELACSSVWRVKTLTRVEARHVKYS